MTGGQAGPTEAPAFSLAIRLELRDGSMGAVLELFEAMLPSLRAEEGCLAFVGHLVAGDPHTLWLYESYVSRAYHRDVHSSRPDVRRLLDALTPHLASQWEAWSGDAAFSA